MTKVILSHFDEFLQYTEYEKANYIGFLTYSVLLIGFLGISIYRLVAKPQASEPIENNKLRLYGIAYSSNLLVLCNLLPQKTEETFKFIQMKSYFANLNMGNGFYLDEYIKLNTFNLICVSLSVVVLIMLEIMRHKHMENSRTALNN